MPQMDSKLYAKVKKVMEACGGKWNRKAKAIIFEDQDAADAMIAAGETGTYIDFKKGFQQFDTPELVGSDLIEKLEIPMNTEETLTILEPEAGTGSLVKVLDSIAKEHSVDIQIVAVEIDPKRVSDLESIQNEPSSSLMRVVEADFTLCSPNAKKGAAHYLGQFDYIVMNPPFTRGQDIDHVLHAYKFLKPGGKLAAIMGPGWRFHNTKKADEFRDFVEENGEQQGCHGENYGDIPEGAFKVSGTNVKTTWVVLQKPE